MTREGHVFFRDRKAGTLSESVDGMYRFAYDSEYRKEGPAISLTLPLRAEPFESRTLFPFFAGLVPEGWYLRIVAATLKLDENDTFGLLLRACADCVGAVSIKEVTNAAVWA